LAALLVAGLALSGVLSACGTDGAAGPTPTPTLQPTPTPGFASPLYWPTTEWRTSTPEEQGVDSVQLLRALEHIDQDSINIRSMTVIRNGYIVLEAYYQPWNADHMYPVFSVTKSVTGMLVGIAIEEGAIKDIKQPVLSFFPDRTIKNLDANKKAITVEDLVSMQPGLDCADDKLNWAMEASEDWVQFVLDLPMATPPGENLVYCTAGTHLLSAILTEATGMSTIDYAQSRLFDPLGISPDDIKWGADPQAITYGGYGLELRPHDLAKFGLLLERSGKWEGKQVIPEKWISAATQVHAYGGDNKNYGYGLWVYPTHFAAEGMGEQLIPVVAGRDLVVVITSAIDWRKGTVTRQLLEDYVFPAASADDPLPANPDALKALQDKVKFLANPVKPVPPMPDTAQRISGQTYILAENDSGWKSVSLTFEEGKSEAQAMVINASGEVSASIGLDNVYRVTALPDGNTIGLRGWWEDEDTFVTRQVQTSPYLEEVLMRMDFTPAGIKIRAQEPVLGNFDIQMSGVVK
jgi:CubicO group peptidase (beta-lactamase class C family)